MKRCPSIRTAFGLLPLLAASALAQTPLADLPREDFLVPDGPVRAVLEADGVLYVGGRFDYLSPAQQTGDAFDAVSGSPVPGFPKFGGSIRAILRDEVQGGWYVGGTFSAAGDVVVQNLARVRPDLTVDPEWRPEPNGPVFALASDGERLFVGGAFSTIASESHDLLAALDIVSGRALPWRADCTNTTPNASVNALLVADGRLFVGGYFRAINSIERMHIGSVDAATGAVDGWKPNGFSGSETGTHVDTMALAGHTLYVGGTFLSMGDDAVIGVIRRSLAALDIHRNLLDSVLPWNPDADGPVAALAVSCDTVFIAGNFTRIGGQPRHHLAAVDAVTGRTAAWNPDPNDEVASLQLSGDAVFVGGRFKRVGGQARQFLAALDPTSGQATTWTAPTADFGVAGLAVRGGTVVAGGVIGPGGHFRHNLAAFDARTGRLLDWAPEANGAAPVNGLPIEGVHALAAGARGIYVAGAFTDIGGVPRNRLACVDPVTGAALDWNPDADNLVESLLATPGAVYAAGIFKRIGGQSRNKVAALDPSTGAATPWDPAPDDKVTALAEGLPGRGVVYVGGRFIRIDGQIHRRLAAFDASNGAVTPWNPVVNDQVTAIAATPERVIIGGLFSTVNGQPRSRLAALDPIAGLLDCWDPHPRQVEDDQESAAGIHALLADAGSVIAAGRFNRIAGATRRNLAAIQTECPATAATWNPDVDGDVDALTANRSSQGSIRQLAAGGTFQFAGGRYHPNLAVFPTKDAPRVVRHPRGQQIVEGGTVRLDTEVVGAAPLIYQWQRNGVDLPGANHPTLELTNLRVDQSGDYTVVVTNSFGLVNSRAARVVVIQPVSIAQSPLSQTVAAGTTLTLSVVATGNPPPAYQWRLNGNDIPGATSPTLTLSNAQPTDGGQYDVVVANLGGLVVSPTPPAIVRILSPTLPFADSFADAGMISGPSGQGSGNNIAATQEPGETNHVGKAGGASVWLRWTAPANGIASFHTRGSSFDTLLAVYSGNNVGALSPVASDEDRAGYLTSRVLFNAVAGTEYRLAVDGFAGAAGDIVLSWNLDISNVEFPRILAEPLNVTVTRGEEAQFAVVVSSPSPVTYQWYFGCQAIAGATNATLMVPRTRTADVGQYRVVVQNDSRQPAESVPAVLEIGPETKVVSRDKVEDILRPPAERVNAGVKRPDGFFPATTSGSGFLSVSLGSAAGQTVNTTGSSISPKEPLHCEVEVGATRWLGLRAQGTGTMIVDTLGSQIDTVLAVYGEPPSLTNLYANLITCDNNGAPDGSRSVVQFPAVAGAGYLVVAAGANKANGTIQVNWRLGNGPAATTTTPARHVVSIGGRLELTTSATNGVPPPVYQWFWNGQRILGATNASLVLTNLQAGQSGTYSVLSSNFIASALDINAVVTVGEVPSLQLSNPGRVPGGFGFQLSGSTGRAVVVEATTNLSSGPGALWTPLLTNAMTQSPVQILDTNAGRFPRRWYRAVAP